jgi:hypothetical protein
MRGKAVRLDDLVGHVRGAPHDDRIVEILLETTTPCAPLHSRASRVGGPEGMA